ncbi:MAG: hypothetical protein JSV03_13320 [Planctomycetota bacterium]|nr:MAG: hypothetical protein JSV03_13320 [Planctomycetota bacterium]
MTADQGPLIDSPQGDDRTHKRESSINSTSDLQGIRNALSDEEWMLLRVRDELYGGSWDQFVIDLKARLSGKPYVFEIGPPSDQLIETIGNHLRIIEKLRATETQLGVNLSIQ